MNPEEGRLRPQIQDRFGLRVVVDGLHEPEDRLEVYRRVKGFREQPHRLVAHFDEDTFSFGQEIARARERLLQVELAPEAERLALRLVQDLGIPSHRAEITALEAARAYAAADGRCLATAGDVAAVAPMAFRQRQSEFIVAYLQAAREEGVAISGACSRLAGAQE